MKRIIIIITGLIFLTAGKSSSQDFVYTPVNPAFGGDTFNYQWMLSSAQAQDTYKAPSVQSDYYSYSRDPVKDFAESLNRQILSRLSREIITRQFGEDALEEGSYILGDYQIEIMNAAEGISILIADSKTGATTTISVPYF